MELVIDIIASLSGSLGLTNSEAFPKKKLQFLISCQPLPASHFQKKTVQKLPTKNISIDLPAIQEMIPHQTQIKKLIKIKTTKIKKIQVKAKIL